MTRHKAKEAENIGFSSRKDEDIKTSDLLSYKFVSNTKKVIADRVLTVWFCSSNGQQWVQSEEYGSQNIDTLAIPSRISRKIANQLFVIDTLTGLDIKIVNTKESADIRIYLDKNIDLGIGPEYAALTTFNSKSKRPNWEIFLNQQEIKDDNYMVYTILHEIGHTIGLEHTHDDSDGDFHLTTNARRSSLPRQTVMSYAKPEWNIYPERYQVNDIRALQHAWGLGTNKLEIDKLTRMPKPASLNSDSIINIHTKNGNNVYLKGQASPSSKIKTWLSNVLLTETTATENGDWKMVFTKQIQSSNKGQLGAYLKIEQLDAAGHLTVASPYFINFIP